MAHFGCNSCASSIKRAISLFRLSASQRLPLGENPWQGGPPTRTSSSPILSLVRLRISLPPTLLRSFGQKGILGKFLLKVSTADGSESTSNRTSNLNFAASSFAFKKPSENP